MSYPTVPDNDAPSSTAHAPVANTTAIKAIPPASRSNGMTVIDQATQNQWVFASGSSASGSGYVLVPDVGTGRWLIDPSTVGVAAAAAAQADATTALADASDALFVANTADGRTIKPKSLTITHSDLTAVATTQTITIDASAVPAGARMVYVLWATSVNFSGGGVVSLEMDVGWSGQADALVDGSAGGMDLVTGVLATRSEFGLNAGTESDIRDIAGKTLQAKFTCDGGHTLDQLTAGSIYVEVGYFVPA